MPRVGVLAESLSFEGKADAYKRADVLESSGMCHSRGYIMSPES